ncbi:bifunctional diguanylate cyclase/phosphodiesterase [Algiphilus sp.]|uniref:putative bifunctional diguanylate cyclase/phosphodiesterase n=1 Tax=Algiphilus sp. TaxID=1872431 RepID=UPI0025C0BA80|nr:GGDEF domain-containing phosphodiesterase [Algiphilus sp.]MCK5769121.1 EAL domain-containing protein [Algiphilus sp.]
MSSLPTSPLLATGAHADDERQRPERVAGRIAIGYAVVVLAWILGSDYLLTAMSVALVDAEWWQHSLKGAAFTIVTASLLYSVLRRNFRRQAALQRDAEATTERLRLAMEGSSAAAWVYSPRAGSSAPFNGDLEISAELKALIGSAADDPPHDLADWHARIHPDDIEPLRAASSACLSGASSEYRALYRIRHRDGSWHWLDSRGRRAPGDGNQWIGMVWDVTALREARESGNLLTSLFDNAPDGLLVTDSDDGIVRANDAAARLFGLSRPEIEARAFDAELLNVVDPGRLKRALMRVHRDHYWAGDLKALDAEGAQRLLYVRMSAVRNEHGAPPRYMVLISDVTSEADARQRLEFLSRYDPLTELPNASYFREEVDRALVQTDGGYRALLCIDLDRFQPINELLGTAAGDRVLAECASRLRMVAEPMGVVCRPSGDSFSILSPPLADTGRVDQWLERVATAFRPPFEVLGNPLLISYSGGVAMWPDDAGDATTLQVRAETALAQARSRGGGRALRYEPAFSEASASALWLEGALRDALTHDRIECHLQPIVDLAEGHVIGAEALARWCLDGRWVSPSEFAPVAEARGLVGELSDLMLRKSAAAVQRLERAGRLPPGFRVSVNLSSLQVVAELPGIVARALERCGMRPDNLCLELTESAVIQQPDTAIRALGELRASGITVSIDDFGTGYSSLTQLQRLPVDFVKLDRGFIQKLHEDQASRGIVRAIMALARTLDLQTIAEGVENDAQREALLELGCTTGQGFLMSPALAPEVFEAWLADPWKPPATTR